jgi:hypothetical protein
LGAKWKVFINQDVGFEDIDSEIITVKFNPNVTAIQKTNFAGTYGLTYISNTILGWYDYKLNQNEVLPLVQNIKDLSIINKININHTFSYFTTPNDPMCNTSNANYQAYLDNIKHFDALALMPTVKGESGCNTIVAVLDNGFNYNSTELYDPTNNVNQIWHNAAEDDWTNKADPTTGNGIDDDNNGYVDDWVGWDFGGYNAGGPDNDPKFGTL